MKIGIFGGCFNPPHNKHKQIAKDLLKYNYVDKIIYVPTGDYYNKKDLIKFKDRYNMLNILFKNENNIEISDICKDKSYRYTYQVLDYYQKKYSNCKIYFICGLDNIFEFNTWKNYEYILSNFYLLVVNRNNLNIKKLDKKILNKLIITNIKEENISSTIMRNKIKNNIYDLELDKEVLEYIQKHNLYI